MKILGIDPGTKRMGYGLIEVDLKKKLTPIDYGCIEPKSNKEEEILDYIYEALLDLLKKHEPDLVAIEKLFFFKNQKTAFQVSQARGIMILACHKTKTKIFQPTPLEIKTCVTGYGRADKKSVALMVKNILKLEKIPKLDDTTDALAGAITAFYLKNKKI